MQTSLDSLSTVSVNSNDESTRGETVQETARSNVSAPRDSSSNAAAEARVFTSSRERLLGALGARLDRSRLVRRARTRLVPWLDRASTRLDADLPWAEAALRSLDATLSLKQVRARVLAVREETHDVKTFVLRPNARFGSFRPGSYVTLDLTIDGRRVQRSYSMSSAPSPDGSFAITVKRVADGLVSNWLADHLKPGDVLTISVPRGQFVLPEVLPERLLLISAGSGITPVMSMLRALLGAGAPSDITFLHFARSPRDLIFRDELTHLARVHPRLKLAFCVEEADDAWEGARGRFSLPLLEEVEPGFRTIDTYLCGPSGFMQAVMQGLERAEADLERLRYERFDASFDAAQFLSHVQVVRFLRSGAERLANQPRTILEEAEALGIAVETGCRAGNCGTCACTKRRGVVIDVTTGRESGPGEELIYPCISVARGTVEVDL